MLNIFDLSCERNSKIIFKNLSFKLKNNMVLQIIADNGKGKTSLLRTLCGLLVKKNGKIQYNKIFIKNLTDIFYIGNKQTLYKFLTPIDNLLILAKYSNTNCTTTNIIDALKFFNLHNFSNIPCYELSTGQCQKVFLTQLLLIKAQIFFLDEPFLFLDEQGIILTKSLIISLLLQKNKQIVITTHSVIEDLLEYSVTLHL